MENFGNLRTKKIERNIKIKFILIYIAKIRIVFDLDTPPNTELVCLKFANRVQF